MGKALHDIEWVLSCDMGEGDEEPAIKAVLGELAELEQTVREAIQAREALDAAIVRSARAREVLASETKK